MASEYVSNQCRMQALRPIPANLEFAFSRLEDFFSPLSKPGPHDWLASQNEPGQTVSDFERGARCPTRSQGKVYIQPLDSQLDSEMLNFLQAFAAAFFHPATIAVLPALELAELRVASRMNGCRQYHAGEIIERLKSRLPRDAFCLVGITMEDLYPRDTWNFVYGLARSNTGVFSFCRYLEGADREEVIFRSVKVMTHEIAHMFGLKHCIYYQCALNGSMHAGEAFSRPAHLCPVCLLKLHRCLGFNIEERYQLLADICDKVPAEGFVRERDWYRTRIQAITARS